MSLLSVISAICGSNTEPEPERFCPNCGAILNDQNSFDPEDGNWICTKCRMHPDDEQIYGLHASKAISEDLQGDKAATTA